MTTLEQVKDVPFIVRVKETNSFVREVPYNDQAKKSSRLVIDFDRLANHALHNRYCISFIKCPFPLCFDSLISHFDWCSRYLYFNFEESMLRIEIFTKLEKQYFDNEKLKYLIGLLIEYPQAYQYTLDEADHTQQWALRKKFNFQKNADFLKIVETDRRQRLLVLNYLQVLLEKSGEGQIISTESIAPSSSNTREREASTYNYLKLNDELSSITHTKIIEFLHTSLEPCFRKPYDINTFTKIFYEEDSPELELIKRDNMDNQSFKIIFRELKDLKGLVVSWLVIDRKIRVFKSNGFPFSSFSQVSMGKINPKKRKQMENSLSPIIALIKSELTGNKRK